MNLLLKIGCPLSFISHLMPVLLTVSLIFSGWVPPINQRPLKADWCQCVIFILNMLGIEQIPGEYWTAASLAVPDASGKTWMDYQGYTKRPTGQSPQTGDLLVLDGGAEVITVQIWDQAEHLVPVPVDVWAGHIGIVLDAELVEKENARYQQVNLLSANWGVSSTSLGVVGSCFNVDQSIFLLPENYKKASFFYASDPVKMRERMVNRAKRWSNLGLTANPQASLDGFPITPSGFISEVLQPVGNRAITPAITDIQKTLIDIQPEAALTGDFVLFGDESNPGLGVISAFESDGTDKGNPSYEVIAFQQGGKVTIPEKWEFHKADMDWYATLPDKTTSKVRFYRYKDLPDHSAFWGKIRFSRDSSNEDRVDFALTDGGTGEITVNHLVLKAYSILPDSNSLSAAVTQVPMDDYLTLKPGELVTLSAPIRFPTLGNYLLGIQFEVQNKTIQIMDYEKLTIN